MEKRETNWNRLPYSLFIYRKLLWPAGKLLIRTAKDKTTGNASEVPSFNTVKRRKNPVEISESIHFLALTKSPFTEKPSATLPVYLSITSILSRLRHPFHVHKYHRYRAPSFPKQLQTLKLKMATSEEISNGKTSSFSNLIPTIKFTQLFINGQFVDAVSGRTLETISPRTGEVIARVAEGDSVDVDLAVAAARQAFDHGPWPRMSGFARGRVLSKFADLIDQNADELAGLESIDAGKLFTFNKMADIPFAANLLRYYAGAADKIHGDVLKMSRELHGYTLLEPIGVVGHIIPWNFPCTLFFSKVAPSLAAGCTMVVKPAEQTPLSALFFAHLAREAGIPDGVMNVVVGYGATAGAAISAHMDVDKVSFTGSTEVGRKVMQAAALSNLKPVSLELGGKSPVLIFDDADVDKAVDLALLAIFYNKGEVCAAGSRVFVQEGIYDEFVKKLAVKAKEWTVGDPLDPTTRVGPQVNKTQFERVLSYIEHGKREGATLLTGGKPAAETGFYIQPTVFTDVKEDMMISRDEIFGPVMALMKFKTIEEGIKYANNTKYGLASGIVTKSLDIANTVSRSIKAGVVWINCYHGFDIDCPFGGYKMSGFGKDFGMEALHKYLQTKAVVTPIYNSPWL
ncbi:unnamed protein product [Linum tenue]|uniref:Aldehyde dehydrogenase 1 n=1 Tax=Linum tenue TaxID=586396 RepID=A0AAV0S7V0_9ROSI|nr:unnamed protein product [Linum tenue]